MTPDNPLVTLGYRLCDTCHVETHPDDLATPNECKGCAAKDILDELFPEDARRAPRATEYRQYGADRG